MLQALRPRLYDIGQVMISSDLRHVQNDPEVVGPSTSPMEAESKLNSNGAFGKESSGPLKGTTGGWPGGEKGLQEFIRSFEVIHVCWIHLLTPSSLLNCPIVAVDYA